MEDKKSMGTKRNGTFEMSAIMAGIIQHLSLQSTSIPFYKRKPKPSGFKLSMRKSHRPHQGERECARRRRQMAEGKLKQV